MELAILNRNFRFPLFTLKDFQKNKGDSSVTPYDLQAKNCGNSNWRN